MAATLLTTKQIMAGFKASDMTIYTWRKGTPTRTPLPCVTDGRLVHFKAGEVRAWAKKHGLAYDASAVTSTDSVRPGPKAPPVKKMKRSKAAKAA